MYVSFHSAAVYIYYVHSLLKGLNCIKEAKIKKTVQKKRTEILKSFFKPSLTDYNEAFKNMFFEQKH